MPGCTTQQSRRRFQWNWQSQIHAMVRFLLVTLIKGDNDVTVTCLKKEGGRQQRVHHINRLGTCSTVRKSRWLGTRQFGYWTRSTHAGKVDAHRRYSRTRYLPWTIWGLAYYQYSRRLAWHAEWSSPTRGSRTGSSIRERGSSTCPTPTNN